MAESFVIQGGKPLRGEIKVAGAKNVALKVLIASLLTKDELILHNIPVIDDVIRLLEILKSLGIKSNIDGHTVSISSKNIKSTTVPLEVGARIRASYLALGPLLARFGEAIIPNPGGCRLGARPIDRHIEGLQKMGANIKYYSEDGYFHATTKKLHGTTYHFDKNSHTGTEALILAAVLAEGETRLQNAAEEVEVDDLIQCIQLMGGHIERKPNREIVIEGVSKLHGAEYTIMSDRNEEVTFAIAAAMTKGYLIVKNSTPHTLTPFLKEFQKSGGIVEKISDTVTKYSAGKKYVPTHVTTLPHPGFMTDWQSPWALFMTQANGSSTVHETIFENRFSYVEELKKMGANIEFYEPKINNPKDYYNFRWEDHSDGCCQAIRIVGPTKLHNAVLSMHDLRAGATLLIAAMSAEGKSYIQNVEQIDRGYERIDKRFKAVEADIIRVTEGGP